MIKRVALLWGFLFLFGGILAFVPGVTNDGMYFGVFMVNTAHNILHIATGISFLIASVLGAKAARWWFKIFGVCYLALAAIGFFVGHGLIFGVIMNSPFDSWGHAALGLILVSIGFFVPNRLTGVPAASRVPRPPPAA